MLTDQRGIPVTVQTKETVERFDEVTTHFLRHSPETSEKLSAILTLEQHFILGQVTRGFLLGSLAQRKYDNEILSALQTAQQGLVLYGGTEREKQYVKALQFLYEGEWGTAAHLLESISFHNPLDALAIKLTHGLYFMLGHNDSMYRATRSILPFWHTDIPDYGYILACHAFSLEETRQYQEAEHFGQQAIALASKNAWGFHALTHVKEMYGQSQEGMEWIEQYESEWSQCNNLRYHMYWHWALFALDREQYDTVLALYDCFIRSIKTDDYRDISNAASLLLRLECEGVDVGQRWSELALLAGTHIGDHKLMFADAHYLMSLAFGGQLPKASEFIDSLEKQVYDFHKTRSDQLQLAHDTVLELLQGILAVAKGKHVLALERLFPIRHAIQKIGGSHAQRDVFSRLLITTALVAQRFDLAKQCLQERQVFWSGSRWHEKKALEIENQTQGVV